MSLCGCPEGYDLNSITDLCESIISQEPTILNSTQYTAASAIPFSGHGFGGAVFYENIDNIPFPIRVVGSEMVDQANSNLTKDYTLQNDVWGEGANPVSLADGRLNLAGIWGFSDYPTNTLALENTELGFTTCVKVSKEKVYYIGLAADNTIRAKLNGTVIIDSVNATTYNFSRWHVFPITLPVGTHFIELLGANITGAGKFAAEIYDATIDELLNVPDVATLESYLLFSTKDQVGEVFHTGTGSGFICEEGFQLSVCNGAPTCVQVDTSAKTQCNCYIATDCRDGSGIISFSTETPLDESLTYELPGYTGICWTVVLAEGECEEVATIDESLIISHTNCITCSGEELIPVELGESCDIKKEIGEPGFSSKHCSPEEYININCNFGDHMYKIYQSNIYGIEHCCPYDSMSLEINKRLLELGELNNPDFDCKKCLEVKPCETETKC